MSFSASGHEFCLFLNRKRVRPLSKSILFRNRGGQASGPHDRSSPTSWRARIDEPDVTTPLGFRTLRGNIVTTPPTLHRRGFGEWL